MPLSPKRSDDGALLRSVPDAAARLGLSRKTFNRMIDAGEVTYVQFVRPNGARWIEETELQRLIRKFRVKAPVVAQPVEPVPAPASAA